MQNVAIWLCEWVSSILIGPSPVLKRRCCRAVWWIKLGVIDYHKLGADLLTYNSHVLKAIERWLQHNLELRNIQKPKIPCSPKKDVARNIHWSSVWLGSTLDTKAPFLRDFHWSQSVVVLDSPALLILETAIWTHRNDPEDLFSNLRYFVLNLSFL